MNNTALKYPIRISICAHPNNLSVVRAAVRAFAEQAELSNHDVDKIILAVSEALTNVIRHGYNGPCDQPIEICMGPAVDDASGRTGLEWIIRDYGKTVDPATIKGRDLDDVRPGGLGMHIIHATMDIVRFEQPPDKGMILTLVKFLEPHRENSPLVPHRPPCPNEEHGK